MKKEIKLQNNELFYNGYSLTNLAKKYGTPLRVSFLGVIKDHVLELKDAYAKAIKKNNYDGKFIYVNANKANYEFQEVKTAYEAGDGIETSSYYDLLLSKEISKKDKPIICNGIKGEDYLDEIIKLTKDGYYIINILDSYDEYETLKQMAIKEKVKVEVGCRIHIPSLYIEDGSPITDDRFGMMEDEFTKIVDDIKDNGILKLTTIHFHQRGFEFEKDKFVENLEKVLIFYDKAASKLDTICNFDMGGGTPLPTDYSVNYEEFADLVIRELMKLTDKYHVKHPNLISENGKYSQKDSTVNIYEVVSIKNTCKYPWYVLNGSLLIAMPEMYALGEEIIVEPINNLDNETIEGRLSSITCDCDDVLYDKKKGFFDLPKFDIKREKQFVAILGTGSYQNSMAGKRGWHHCLLPEEIDVVVDVNGNEYVRHPLQSFEEIKELISFKK